jgi:N-acetylmuramoyl-L-alanine amidase
MEITERDKTRDAIFFILKLAAVSLVLTLAAIALNYIGNSIRKPVGAEAAGSSPGMFARGTLRVIVDPGHGGRDGGAVSITGTPEKTLNLEISLTLAELLRVIGVDVIETRTTDSVVGGEAPKGMRKMSDLRGRLLIAQANPDALFVSIHMNKFPDSQYRGLQVWYSKNDERSKVLAGYFRSATVSLLQPDNTRQIKPAGSGIFLMHRAVAPAITVECGFLSNPEEAAALETKEYRDALATVFTGALAGYHNGVGE